MRPKPARLMILAAVFLVAPGCSASTTTSSTTTGPPAGALPVGDPNYPMPGPHSCHIRQENGQDLPDPHCAGGAVNPQVSQENIGSTICKSGWTATIRPPVSTTDKWKRESALSYGLPSTEQGEYDHLISLELGGAPLDTRNLWVEPGKIPNPKDNVENALHKAVCDHRVTLSAAQNAIAADWTTAEHTLGLG